MSGPEQPRNLVHSLILGHAPEAQISVILQRPPAVALQKFNRKFAQSLGPHAMQIKPVCEDTRAMFGTDVHERAHHRGERSAEG
jgi:hypothetical protein